MPVRIRLQRKGRKKKPFYHIVIADIRAPRDGRYIERLGTYNPLTVPATIDLDREKAYEWLMKGAQPTDTVRAMLKFKGVYYKKHLQRGVAKGAMTQEEADKLLAEWIEAKEAKVQTRREKDAQEREDRRMKIFGVAPKPKPKAEEVEEEAPAEEENTEEAATEEAPEASNEEKPADEEAKAEETKEEPKEEEKKDAE